eukprot:scaffold78978_cov41-Tisochrysis_lutea.AAC.3
MQTQGDSTTGTTCNFAQRVGAPLALASKCGQYNPVRENGSEQKWVQENAQEQTVCMMLPSCTALHNF